MIKKLRRKFIWIVMAVVTIILLAIFFTMLFTSQRNNERISIGMLRQALNMRPLLNGAEPPFAGGNSTRPEGPSPQTRLPILIAEIDGDANVSVLSNQLHFIGENEIAPIAALAAEQEEDIGILPNYALRYLRETTAEGIRIAFADISVEQEILRTQIADSLLIGGIAMLAFFLLSLALAGWAVRPVAAAWEQQKQFIENASHELKTPLTVILSNADMLLGGIEETQNARRMAHIHAEALRMKQLVEDMLTLAQSERAEHHDMLDFSYLVKSAVLMYEPIIYDEGKKFFYEIEDGLSVKGDMRELQQVTHILLDNARKYAAPGGFIHVGLQKAEHKRVLLRVSNEGTLIPKNELEHIFLRFYRQDQSRSEHGSFGLGLSIAKSIVTMHKGRIWAESDEKSGNVFYVSLPLAQE